MPPDTLWTLVGVAAAALTSTSFIPQLLLRLRRPGQARLAFSTLFIFVLGASLWTAYGFHRRDAIIIGANLLVIVTLAAIAVVQWLQER